VSQHTFFNGLNFQSFSVLGVVCKMCSVNHTQRCSQHLQWTQWRI